MQHNNEKLESLDSNILPKAKIQNEIT